MRPASGQGGESDRALTLLRDQRGASPCTLPPPHPHLPAASRARKRRVFPVAQCYSGLKGDPNTGYRPGEAAAPKVRAGPAPGHRGAAAEEDARKDFSATALSLAGPEEPTQELRGGEGGRAGKPQEKRQKELTFLSDELEEEDEWTEEVQKEQERQLRAELLAQYRPLLVERSQYQRYSLYLQHKIFEALRRKKGQEAGDAPDRDAEPESPQKENSYLHYLAVLEELKKQEADDLDWYHQELDQLKQQCEEKLTRVDKAWQKFQALKKQVMMQVMGSYRMRGGRQAALREVEQVQQLEDKKEEEMRAVRLENMQLKQSLVHFETRMRAQEDMAEGLLLIDFEQLKIENQTFNEKVEERNEELLKLRNKVSSNVQVVTHVKEKLHHVELHNTGLRARLLEAEAQVALRRDILTRTKQARDALRTDSVALNRKCGLLGKEQLLRDLEEKADQTEALRQRLEFLKRHHAGLTLSCRGVRQKIREAKAFLRS
ncbi:PREDICTED: coiled-coil domain-containing protein 96 [Condylura cristata]|uniref:coiled-coil domain-containing protein 96 n=1 Tax=Condylura cristata TaxID=143302 RepID=UPI0006432955|nr:PREDICTED: coiled-coil domain-containing protein 96 [Condylura cristata]